MSEDIPCNQRNISHNDQNIAVVEVKYWMQQIYHLALPYCVSWPRPSMCFFNHKYNYQVSNSSLNFIADLDHRVTSLQSLIPHFQNLLNTYN